MTTTDSRSSLSANYRHFTDARPSVADIAINKMMVWIACVVYIIGYAGFIFGDALSFLRYLHYAVPAILFAPLFLQNTLRVNKPACLLLLAYLSQCLLLYFFGDFDETERLCVNFVCICLIIVSFIPKLDVSDKQIRLVYHCTFTYLAINFFLSDHEGIRFFQLMQDGNGSAVGGGYDRQEGLLGAAYAIFFFATGATVQFILALVMSLLAGKRIALLAILGGLIFLGLMRWTAVFKDQFNRFIALLATLAVINVLAVNLLSISEGIHQYLEMKIHIEEVMLGRHRIAEALNDAIDNKSLSERLLGSGPGAADALAIRVSSIDEPHNDWLKIFYDYGILGSIAAMIFMALIFSSSAVGAAIAVSTAVVMMTDNVLIYLFYYIPVALLVAHSAACQSRVSEFFDGVHQKLASCSSGE